MVRWAIDPQTTDREVPDQVLKNIRVELFKMYYEKNEFVLNAKADAFETLQTLLSCIHVYYSSKIMKPKAKGEFQKALDYDCGQSCFVHTSVGLACKMHQVCADCGPKSKLQRQDKNLFAMTINAAEILSLMPRGQNVFANHQGLISLYSKTLANERTSPCGKKKQHKIKTAVSLHSDPDVIMFNVCW